MVMNELMNKLNKLSKSSGCKRTIYHIPWSTLVDPFDVYRLKPLSKRMYSNTNVGDGLAHIGHEHIVHTFWQIIQWPTLVDAFGG